MSTGDDEPQEGDGADGDGEGDGHGEGEADATEERSLGAVLEAAADALDADDLGEEELGAALDEIDAALDLAETEADLDEVESALDDADKALDEADLPEPDDDDEDEAAPGEALASRADDLRQAVADDRGPYAEDVVEALEAARETVGDTRWTEAGETDLVEVASAFAEAVADALDAEIDAPDDPEAATEAIDATIEAIESADLDPDGDAATIAALVEAADDLSDGLDAAEEWGDLSTQEQLDAEGFYDVLDHRKDYPPEWHALKEWEQRGDAEMVLLALEKLGSEFMEEHCLDALRRMGPEEALEPMLERAERRDRPAIEILGKIGSDEAVDSIVEYAEADGDPQLQKTTLKALGEIGSSDATQAVADQLLAESPAVRSRAARALGLIGDPRGVDPLVGVLEDDDADEVRASAAWALVQIGTEAALEAASEHADDRSYLVQAEAEKADEALGAVEA